MFGGGEGYAGYRSGDRANGDWNPNAIIDANGDVNGESNGDVNGDVGRRGGEFVANLGGENEVPPVDTGGSGEAHFTVMQHSLVLLRRCGVWLTKLASLASLLPARSLRSLAGTSSCFPEHARPFSPPGVAAGQRAVIEIPAPIAPVRVSRDGTTYRGLLTAAVVVIGRMLAEELEGGHREVEHGVCLAVTYLSVAVI